MFLAKPSGFCIKALQIEEAAKKIQLFKMIKMTRESTIGIMQQTNFGSGKVKNSKSKKEKGANGRNQNDGAELDLVILDQIQEKESAGESYRTEFDSPSGLVVCDFPPLEKAETGSGEKYRNRARRAGRLCSLRLQAIARKTRRL